MSKILNKFLLDRDKFILELFLSRINQDLLTLLLNRLLNIVKDHDTAHSKNTENCFKQDFERWGLRNFFES